MLVGACALCASASNAMATDYYVRKSGSNGATGTSPAQAFRTIDKAADVAGAGDTVYVGAGTYTETVTPSNDGTAGSPITFIADTTGAETGDAGEVILQRAGTSGNALGSPR